MFPYLRFIKKVLNHNRIINNNAYYDNNRTIWYTKYCAYGIPLYYTEYIVNEKFNNSFYLDSENENDYIFDVLKLVAFNVDKLNISDFDARNNKLKEVLKLELQKEFLGDKQIEILEDLSFVNGNINDYFLKGFNSEKYSNSRKSLFELYYNFGEMITKDNIYTVNVKWRTYYDYKEQEWRYSKLDCCNLLPLTLTDFVIDIKQIEVPEEDKNWLAYVRYYNIFSDGWRYDGYDYCFPKIDSDSGNFVSKKSKKYPDEPIKKISIVDVLNGSSIYTVEFNSTRNTD